MPIVKAIPRLKEVLKSRNMTQEELSEKSQVPQGSISRFDSRTRHDASHMFSIADVLGISIEELFVRAKEEG